MKIHLDLDAGIAGDMFLAACLDLGLDQDELTSALKTMSLPAWSLDVRRQHQGGLSGLQLDVVFPKEHVHRHLGDILGLIRTSALSNQVKVRAEAIFRILAEAEGQVHGISPEKVHFHEVGAVDAIVDICGAAYAIWKLGIEEITATPPVVGSGTVRCAHGVMPVPVPAVTEIIKKFQIPIRSDSVVGELVTPTGAAILANLVNQYGPLKLDRIDRVGYGLGHRDLADRANALRILAQHTDAADPIIDYALERVSVLSAHVDDMNPEWYEPLWTLLFEEGALDVALIPITMKKGRPGVRLEVVVKQDVEGVIARNILRHTTSLGVRVARMDRWVLGRKQRSVVTPWGTVRVIDAGGVWRLEHVDLARVAGDEGWSLPEARQRLQPFLDKEREKMEKMEKMEEERG
ncbi:MAG: nickel pincer cofactor biosynthesis protein LarC [Magnetococcales bacterium]|nr:nickel pincer cofactor biosynthesis protein LarC [Magnetococcales bacterium]